MAGWHWLALSRAVKKSRPRHRLAQLFVAEGSRLEVISWRTPTKKNPQKATILPAKNAEKNMIKWSFGTHPHVFWFRRILNLHFSIQYASSRCISMQHLSTRTARDRPTVTTVTCHGMTKAQKFMRIGPTKMVALGGYTGGMGICSGDIPWLIRNSESEKSRRHVIVSKIHLIGAWTRTISITMEMTTFFLGRKKFHDGTCGHRG